ncbi:MAG: hypothetical protein L6R45_35305 [Anaerolineae bacterium]|nr:hypothetical protein [Anaerolineae bacterium]
MRISKKPLSFIEQVGRRLQPKTEAERRAQVVSGVIVLLALAILYRFFS